MTTTTHPAAAPAGRRIEPTRALRALLRVNGLSNVTGVLLVPLAGVLAAPMGLPAGVLAAAGVFYLLYGSSMWFAATRRRPRAGAVAVLVAVNPLWALVCVLLVGAGATRPTTLGSVLLGAEAVIVTVLGVLETVGYRRSRCTRPDAGGAAVVPGRA